MDDLFVVYRYLTNNRHATDGKNPYNRACRALDSCLEIEYAIAHYADKIHGSGGLMWSEAEKLTEHVLTSFEVETINHYGGTLDAAKAFIKKYAADLADLESLISFCQKEQARIRGEEKEEDESSAEEAEEVTNRLPLSQDEKEEIAQQVEREMRLSQVTRSSFSSDEAYEAWEQENR